MDTEPFQIIEVPSYAQHAPEAMGTKPKFWFYDKELGHCLFKESRPGTGEDWAEKMAAELAELLGLPHARIELAACDKTRGTVSPSFVEAISEFLVHGNEALFQLVPGYPKVADSRGFHRNSQHTFSIVMEAIQRIPAIVPRRWKTPTGILQPIDVFTGYLMFDGWISNTDCHHENWGWVINIFDKQWSLAPTYDHASSLGRNESDENRKRRLTTSDRGYSIEAYVEKARSALYASEGETQPMSPFEAFYRAALRQPVAAKVWLGRLESVSSDDTLALFQRIPKHLISPTAVQYAQKMLGIGRDRLLDVRKDIM